MPLPNNPGLPNQRPNKNGQGLPRPNPQRGTQNNVQPNLNNGKPNPNQQNGQRQQRPQLPVQGNAGQQGSGQQGNPNAPINPNAQQRRPQQNVPQNQQNPSNRQNVDERALQARNSEEYNYESGQAQLRARLQQSSRNSEKAANFKNQYDNEDDGTFETLSIDEQLGYEKQEEEEQKRREAKRKAAERRAQQKAEEIRAERRHELEREMNALPEEPEEDENIVFDEEPEDFNADIDFNDPETDEETNIDEDSDDNVEEEKKSSKKNNKKDMFEDNVKDEHGQDVFVDEKNVKLLPFGSKNGKKQKTKEHEYEDRKNLRTQAVIVQFVLIAGLLVLMGLGVKNTFFPEPAMTEDDITGIISQTVDLTNFPLERGGGFATDFTQAYLSTDPEGQSNNTDVLSYFYGGSIKGDSEETAPNRVVAPGYTQNILYGPTIYDSVALTDYSARYTVGVVVEPKPAADAITEEGADAGTDTATDEETATVPQWIFLNVNVYYDSDTDKFTITPDSPTVVPENSVGTTADLPAQQVLGEEETDPAVADKVQPVVYGFLNGYRESTPEDHSTLDQYVISNPPADLTQGLGSSYTFRGGSVENAVTYTIYSNPDEPNVLKVQVQVVWLNGATENTSIQLPSTYVLTLEKQSNGMYLVSKFKPLYFVQDEAALQEEADAAAADTATTEE